MWLGNNKSGPQGTKAKANESSILQCTHFLDTVTIYIYIVSLGKLVAQLFGLEACGNQNLRGEVSPEQNHLRHGTRLHSHNLLDVLGQECSPNRVGAGVLLSCDKRNLSFSFKGLGPEYQILD